MSSGHGYRQSALPENLLMLSRALVAPQPTREDDSMSRIEKLSQVLWHCHHHLVWVPKYRYRILQDEVARKTYHGVQVFSGHLGCQVVELNVPPDHVHPLVKVPPKVSIAKLMGTVKGRTAIQIFRRFSYLKKKPYWGNIISGAEGIVWTRLD
jgi:putative transposase